MATPDRCWSTACLFVGLTLRRDEILVVHFLDVDAHGRRHRSRTASRHVAHGEGKRQSRVVRVLVQRRVAQQRGRRVAAFKAAAQQRREGAGHGHETQQTTAAESGECRATAEQSLIEVAHPAARTHADRTKEFE